MAIGTRHTLAQTRVIGAFAKTLYHAARRGGSTVPVQLPGPEYVEYVEAPAPWLVRDFVGYVGGDPSRYRETLPAHLFPQWCFPTLARVLEGVPYSLPKIVNAGCTLRIRAPLPQRARLRVAAQLTNIDDNGRRALLTTRLRTGPPDHIDCLEVEFRSLVPLRARERGSGLADRSSGGKQKPRVPSDAREVKRIYLPRNAGRRFAQLTGDFNPIHWVRPYARMMGFPSVILHGFGSLSWTMEALIGDVLAGDVARLSQIEANFVRPLVLPRSVGVYVSEADGLTLGDAPGGAAYLAGRFALASREATRAKDSET